MDGQKSVESLDDGVMASVARQVRAEWWVVAVAVGGSVLVVAAMVALKYVEDVPFGDLSRDASVVLDGPPYAGALSQVGLFLWAAIVAVGLFVAWVRCVRVGLDEVVRFLLAAVGVALVLGIDDAFLIHEHVGQKLTFSVYLVMVAVWLVVFRRVVLRTPFLVLAVALGFFFGSTVFDVLRDHVSGPLHSYFLEDVLKLLGIATWAAYTARLGGAALTGDADDLLHVG